MGSYKMSVNPSKKEMQLEIEGNFTPEQATKFIKDYQTKTNAIKANEYVLRLDCRTMNVVTPELVPALEECCKLYKSTSFKDVVFEIGQQNSAVVKMQLARITRTAGLQAQIVAQ